MMSCQQMYMSADISVIRTLHVVSVILCICGYMYLFLKKSKASCSPWAEGCICSMGQRTSGVEGAFESTAVHGVPLFQPPPHSFSSYSAQQRLPSQPSTRIEPIVVCVCECVWVEYTHIRSYAEVWAQMIKEADGFKTCGAKLSA